MQKIVKQSYRPGLRQSHTTHFLAGALLFCLLACVLVACDTGGSSPHHQTVQTDSGSTITYSTQPSDLLVRLFYGGGKVGKIQLTPEISLYGDGTYITGSGLQPQRGSLSSDALQNLLHTLTSTDNLLQLHRQVFSDIPNQNTTLLQVALNGKNYQFVYGPYGHLQESSQDMHEYQQLGDAISAIRKALSGPRQAYTSQQHALLVYQTFRIDFTWKQNQNIPYWTQSTTLSLANAAIYECGAIPPDQTGPNADNGCLVYTVPHLAVLLDRQSEQMVKDLLHGQPQSMVIENGNYFVVMLRPLLPDEIAQHQLAMYGSNVQEYVPVPLKGGPIPIPTASPRA